MCRALIEDIKTQFNSVCLKYSSFPLNLHLGLSLAHAIYIYVFSIKVSLSLSFYNCIWHFPTKKLSRDMSRTIQREIYKTE